MSGQVGPNVTLFFSCEAKPFVRTHAIVALLTAVSLAGSLQLLCLNLTPLFDLCPQFRHLEPVLSSGMQSAGESYKAERWLLHSLQVHMLSAQLRPLLQHFGHTRKYYNSMFLSSSMLVSNVDEDKSH